MKFGCCSMGEVHPLDDLFNKVIDSKFCEYAFFGFEKGIILLLRKMQREDVVSRSQEGKGSQTNFFFVLRGRTKSNMYPMTVRSARRSNGD